MHHIKPIITMQNGNQRQGKGFSPDELKEAGLNAGSARKLGVPVDRKRKTSHDANIETLKTHLKNSTTKTVGNENKKKSKN